MKKRNVIKKIMTVGLAAMMAASALSMNAFAADSIDELVNAPVYYTTNEDGELIIVNDSDISLFDTSVKPLNGTLYVYGSGVSSSGNMLVNTEATDSFSFKDTCTTSTAKYADFLIGATPSSQRVYIQGQGDRNTSVKITLVPIGAGSGLDSIGPKTLSIRSSSPRYISFSGLESGIIYAIKITPNTAGQALSGTLTVNGTGF